MIAKGSLGSLGVFSPNLFTPFLLGLDSYFKTASSYLLVSLPKYKTPHLITAIVCPLLIQGLKVKVENHAVV